MDFLNSIQIKLYKTQLMSLCMDKKVNVGPIAILKVYNNKLLSTDDKVF